MEITYQATTGFQLKTRQARLTINPAGRLTVAAAEESISLAGPGEYEVQGFTIIGVNGDKAEAVVYLIKVDDIGLGWVGSFCRELNPAQKELLETVDILIAPSWSVTAGLKPSLVIPAEPGQAEALVKDSGLSRRQEKKLMVNKLNLPEETEIVILEVK